MRVWEGFDLIPLSPTIFHGKKGFSNAYQRCVKLFANRKSRDIIFFVAQGKLTAYTCSP